MARGLCGLGAGMSRGKWWLWALLGLLLITALMWFSKRVPIENDIQIRTTTALTNEGHSWATVDLERRGRDVALSGAAPSPAARLSAIDIAENVYGVRTVEDLTTELILTSASFGLSHKEGKVYLSGAMPTQMLIDSSVTAASSAYGAQNVVNGMMVDKSVSSPSWLEGINTMMPNLASLRYSKIDVTDEGLSLAGLVDSDAAKNNLLGAAGKVFGQSVEESILVKPSGPSVEELAAIAAAKAKAEAERIAMEQAEAYEAERLVTEKAKAEEVAKLAAEMSKAEADQAIADEAARLAAEKAKAEEAVRLAAERAKTEKAAKLAAEQAKVQERVTLMANCQSQLNAAMEEETINFASSSGNIAVASYPLLDRIAALVSNCKGVVRELGATIDVAGHTDTTGNDELNADLSGRRANAVRDYLVTKGVPSDLLNANGYGESNPIADNATAEGRAQNRRIQFDIKQ